MKTRRFAIVVCTLAALLCTAGVSYSQDYSDLLRYSWSDLGFGARSMGMGTSGMSMLDDYSAVYWNPAGLALSKMNQFSFGLSYLSHQNDATYLGEESSFDNNQTSLDHIGLLYAVPTTVGSLSLAIGYERTMDFTTGLSFGAFNDYSSIVQSWDEGTTAFFGLGDTIGGSFVSPVIDSVFQEGRLLEGGGLDEFTLSGATEVGRNLFMGVSFHFLTGSYTYRRQFDEWDDLGVYNLNALDQDPPDIDFDGLTLNDRTEADLSGFNIRAGMLYRFNPNASFGISVKSPSWITVQENWSEDWTSYFDDGSGIAGPLEGVTEYDASTPWVFSAGLSGGSEDFTLAGSVDYTDFTQMEFSNATSGTMDYNLDIKEIFRATVNVRLGAEVKIPRSDVFLRAGFVMLPSPYEGDPGEFGKKYFTGGIGFMMDRSFRLDLAYAHGSWDTDDLFYVDQGLASPDSFVGTEIEHVTTHNIRGTLSYRF